MQDGKYVFNTMMEEVEFPLSLGVLVVVAVVVVVVVVVVFVVVVVVVIIVVAYPSQKVDVSSALNEKFCYIHISVVRRNMQRSEATLSKGKGKKILS